MDYSDLSSETQLFLNKAMDIYSVIKDRKISRVVNTFIDKEFYDFTKLDKKVLSLFIAGFLVDGYLKKLFSEYDDIKLSDLLKFIGINESDIVPLAEENYESYYDENFKAEIIRLVTEERKYKEVNSITPEVIVNLLDSSSISGTDILYYFSKTYKINSGGIFLSDHPMFKTLDIHNNTQGSISEKKESGRRTSSSTQSGFSQLIAAMLEEMDSVQNPQKKTHSPQESHKLGDNVWELLDEIKGKFIGQEAAAEGLFYNIVNNQSLAEMENVPDGQRSIIFIDGPTGTGKTAIAREITENLGVPFVATAMTKYSSAGYVGGDLKDILKDLYKKTNGNLALAERGIVVLDEIDKIAMEGKEDLQMKGSVQDDLLDFLGGGKYVISKSTSLLDTSTVEFDTSKLTFICLGALTDLRKRKTRVKSPIGFVQNNQVSEIRDYSITPQDLISIGLDDELVGRFNTYIHTKEYSKEDLERILRESTISPIIGFRKWAESYGKQVTIDEDVYGLIAQQAYELNLGARALQTVVNNIRTTFLSKVLRGPGDTIHLDAEAVMEARHQMIDRKGRG